ncbi:1,4-dihydroxy-2-naphthoate octaprenyltransferase [bioreactor metagenome]|uniref:1,4-dihydroxy-2-naphthoate octaprenyltransferase n=1 Tax=bioreactor metagenome TaxID=1076179 RepID=A0A644YT25_9ZZZZ
MGGLIPLAVYTALTGQAALWVLWRSAPLILGIGLIMLTNNISDIERDIPAGRKTLAVLMGRLKAAGLYRAMLILWPLLITVMTIVEDFAGAVILPPLFLLAGPALLRQAALPLTPPVRGAAMRGILHLNLVLGLGCILVPLLSRILSGGRL